MKLIKLDGRHNLYRKGYAWAFRFRGWSVQAGRCENAVREIEGRTWGNNNVFWGKPTERFGGRPYYVGIKNESTATLVLLKM